MTIKRDMTTRDALAVELMQKITRVIAQGGGCEEIDQCFDSLKARYGSRSVTLVQGDRNGVPISLPRVNLVQGIADIIARGGGRAEVRRYTNLWEAKHGRTTGKRRK